MTNKLYSKINKILKENKYFFLIILIILITFIEFPYYINAPGGIVGLDKKIVIDNEYKSSGSFNMAYISEYKANIFTLAYAYLNPNFDIFKKEEYLAINDTYETMSYREDLELEESIDNAVIIGYTYASEDIEILSNDIYITYIYSEAETDLKVGDKIVSINDEIISKREDIISIIDALEVDDKIDIEVINDGNTYHRYAYVKDIEGYKYIGIYTTEDIDYKVSKHIDIKFKRNETGPSGGLMMALEIYNELVEEDLTRGYKIVGTGTIDRFGNVGSISGIKYKLKGAVKKHADIFFVPLEDNYEEALEEKEKNNYKIIIVPISNFQDAINYLNNL